MVQDDMTQRRRQMMIISHNNHAQIFVFFSVLQTKQTNWIKITIDKQASKQATGHTRHPWL